MWVYGIEPNKIVALWNVLNYIGAISLRRKWHIYRTDNYNHSCWVFFVCLFCFCFLISKKPVTGSLIIKIISISRNPRDYGVQAFGQNLCTLKILLMLSIWMHFYFFQDPLAGRSIFSGNLFQYLEENRKWRNRFVSVPNNYSINLYESKLVGSLYLLLRLISPWSWQHVIV